VFRRRRKRDDEAAAAAEAAEGPRAGRHRLTEDEAAAAAEGAGFAGTAEDAADAGAPDERPIEEKMGVLSDLGYDEELEFDEDNPDLTAGLPATDHGPVDLGDPETWSRMQRESQARPRPAGREGGPWDGAGDYPETERVDFGSLLVPAVEGFDIQINMAEEQGIWIAIVRGDSGLQLQAFAAPKTSGLWEEDRQEIAAEISQAGGTATEAEGPFGTELHAMLVPEDEGPARSRPPAQPVRFLGVDGPRWFLRGVISGPAARQPEQAAPFEEVFADVVVVRGDHPAPPRDLLEIQLPAQAREALEAQMAADAEAAARSGGPSPFQQLPSPFERGPEITETR
jgi:hypothetical protein